MNKLLSIITVTKNCVSTIEHTLKSIELVKSDEIEYIVVDGLSDDGTLQLIKKHSEIIDHFICETDTGIYHAMNKGVARASGGYVLFINGDDEIIPEGVKHVCAILPYCKEQVVCATTMVVGDDVNPSFSYIPNPPKLVYWDSIPHPSSFVKRELLVKFPFREDLKIASDYDFFLKIFLAGIPFKIVPYQSALHYYGGVSSDTKKTKEETDLILKDHLGLLRAYYHKAALNLWKMAKEIANQFQVKR